MELLLALHSNTEERWAGMRLSETAGGWAGVRLQGGGLGMRQSETAGRWVRMTLTQPLRSIPIPLTFSALVYVVPTCMLALLSHSGK